VKTNRSQSHDKREFQSHTHKKQEAPAGAHVDEERQSCHFVNASLSGAVKACYSFF